MFALLVPFLVLQAVLYAGLGSCCLESPISPGSPPAPAWTLLPSCRHTGQWTLGKSLYSSRCRDGFRDYT